MDKFDVVVIGGGPGGYVAAIRAAQLGASTALIERDRIGGTCLNRGCMPTKVLLQGVSYLDQVERARSFGLVVGQVSLDYARLQERKDQVVNSLVDDVKGLLADDGVQVFAGVGRLASATCVEVTDSAGDRRMIEAGKIIVATGSAAARPGIPGADSPSVLTSDDVLTMRELPSSLAIVGGGVIGVEIATILAKMGVSVSIVEMMPQILPGEDAEIATALAKSLAKIGVDITVGARVSVIEAEGSLGARITVQAPRPSRDANVSGQAADEERVIAAERILLAVGRRPMANGLGLQEMGIKLNSAAIAVDRQMQTNIPGIYAVGDVVGGVMLAHVASREGIVAAENALGHQASMNYRAIPRCIYTVPEVAAVGISEREATDQGYNISVGQFGFMANGKARIGGETEGFVKVVVDKDYGEILGVHIVGPHATELIGPAALAITAELSAELVRSSVAPHPTLSEAMAEAFEDAFGQAIHVPKWVT